MYPTIKHLRRKQKIVKLSNLKIMINHKIFGAIKSLVCFKHRFVSRFEQILRFVLIKFNLVTRIGVIDINDFFKEMKILM